jgi:Helix-turn-helix domain
MSHSNQEHSQDRPEQAFFSILTHDILFCDKLEYGARLLYAAISSLTFERGYCWASNKYLAEKFKVEERTITNWLHSLKNESFIEIETIKKGMYWDRKIYLIINKSTKGKNFPDRQEQNFPIDGNEFSIEQDKQNNKESSKQATRAHEEIFDKDAALAAAAFSKEKIYQCLNPINLDDKLKASLSKLDSEDIVSSAVARALQRIAEGYQTNNLYGFIKTLIIAKEGPVKEKIGSSKDNAPKDEETSIETIAHRRHDFDQKRKDIWTEIRAKDIHFEDHITYIQIGVERLYFVDKDYETKYSKLLKQYNLG